MKWPLLVSIRRFAGTYFARRRDSGSVHQNNAVVGGPFVGYHGRGVGQRDKPCVPAHMRYHATRVFIPDPGSWEGELTPCARIGIQPLANQCHDKGGPSERHCLPGCGVWHKSVDIWRRQGVGEREGNIQKTITTRHPPALIIPVLRPTQYHHDRHNVTEQ